MLVRLKAGLYKRPFKGRFIIRPGLTYNVEAHEFDSSYMEEASPSPVILSPDPIILQLSQDSIRAEAHFYIAPPEADTLPASKKTLQIHIVETSDVSTNSLPVETEPPVAEAEVVAPPPPPVSDITETMSRAEDVFPVTDAAWVPKDVSSSVRKFKKEPK